MTAGRPTPRRAAAEARALLRRVGARADRERMERKVTRLALAVAMCAVMLSAAVLGVTVSTYVGRIERDVARTVSGDFSMTPDTGSNRARVVFDEIQGEWVVVLLADPATDSPVPPGLQRWPEPGGVALSPSLRGTEEGKVLVARYGDHEDGTIEPAGLTSPEERFVVAVPEHGVMTPGANYALDRFGALAEAGPWSPGISGGALYQRPLGSVLIGLGLGLVLPAALLLVVAARSGAQRRDRRVVVLTALGASPRQILALHLGEFGPSLLVGAVGAVLLAGIAMLGDIPLPYVDFTIQAADVRRGWVLTGALLLLSGLLSLGAVLALNRSRPRRGTRLLPRAPRRRHLGLLWLPLAAAATVRVFTWSLDYEDSWIRILILYLGLALIAGTIPAFIRSATQVLSSLLVVVAHRVRAPGTLIAARSNLAEPGASARLGTGMAIVILLAAHVMVLATVTTTGARTAQTLQRELGTSVLELNQPEQRDRALTELVSVLEGQDAGIVALRVVDPIGQPQRYELFATCPTLESLGIRCRDASVAVSGVPQERLQVIAGMNGATALDVRVVREEAEVATTDDTAQSVSTYVVARDGGQLPLERMRADLAHRSIPSANLSTMGQTWLVGLHDSQDKARWNVLVAAAATVLFAVALACAAIADSRVLCAQVGVVSVWSPAWSTLLALTAIRTLLPLLIAIVTGNVVAWWTTLPFTVPPLDGAYPAMYPVATAVAPVGAAVLVVAVATILQRRTIRQWRPGGGA